MTTSTSLRMPKQAPGVLRSGPTASLRAGDGIAPAGILAALGSLIGLGDEGQAADDAIEAAAHLLPGVGGVYDALSPLGHVITDQIYAAQ
jgi:hypothetical protein